MPLLPVLKRARAEVEPTGGVEAFVTSTDRIDPNRTRGAVLYPPSSVSCSQRRHCNRTEQNGCLAPKGARTYAGINHPS